MDTGIGMNFNFPTDPTKIIKVIGVGGGGVNSVSHMFECGIRGVNFAVCNTDEQSFNGVNVPVKVTLGAGLGSGGNPEKAKEEFEVSTKEVEKLFSDGTKMVFIAAGMGGGTGSGAAPLLAKMAKSKGILTVGIVTIPFLYEKIPRIIQALDAVDEMSKNVDALIVINNERLKEFYPEFELVEAFKKPNEVLAMAVKSIAEIITVKGIINRDFNDVTSTMKDSGVALVSYGFGAGDNRLNDAIKNALDSPLLNNNDISNAKRILFYISFKKDAQFKVDELTKSIDNFMGGFDNHIKMIWGFGVDESLTDDQEVKFTIIATGFGLDVVPDLIGIRDENDFLIKQSILEKHKKDEARVKEIYGGEFNSKMKVSKVSPANIIVLTLEEMDDDKLIGYMENTPTYKRDPKEIMRMRKKTNGKIQKEEITSANSENNDNESKTVIIEF